MNEICPYSKDGKCKSCKVISVDCDGGRFWLGGRYWLCSQYKLESGKITNEELTK